MSSKTTAKKPLERLESLQPEEGFFKRRGAVKGARCFLDSKSGEGLQTVPRDLEATAETVWRDLLGFARSEGKEMELVHRVMFRFNTVILQR